jgi:hypothetical protein
MEDRRIPPRFVAIGLSAGVVRHFAIGGQASGDRRFMPMLAVSLAVALLAGTTSTLSHRLTVLVRIDWHALERYVEVPDTIREIRAVWQPYADIEVIDLDEAGKGPYDDTVRLVVTERAQSDGPSAEALAWITFAEPGQPADVVTVSIDAAMRLLAGARWGGRPVVELPKQSRQHLLARTLARSAAHEIGHYLLRSTAHSRDGLMRKRLPVADLMANDLRAFRLEPPQIGALGLRAALGRLVANSRVQPPGTE